MTADQVVWSEQGRLHLSYTGKVITKAGGDQSGGLIEIEIGKSQIEEEG